MKLTNFISGSTSLTGEQPAQMTSEGVHCGVKGIHVAGLQKVSFEAEKCFFDANVDGEQASKVRSSINRLCWKTLSKSLAESFENLLVPEYAATTTVEE